MLSKKIRYLIMMMFLVLFAVACSDDDDPVTSGDDDAMSVVKGRVVDQNGSNAMYKTADGIEGVVVSLGRIQSDGSIEIISNATATTNGNGEFEIKTSVEAEMNLVIVAEKGDMEWKAVISSELQHDVVVYAPPVSEQSTAEAEVYQEAVAANDDDVQPAEVSMYIDAEFAAMIMNDQSNAAKFKTALKAEAHAYSKALADEYFGSISAAEQKRSDMIRKAQAELNAALYFAGESEAEINAAWNDFYESYFTTLATSDISIVQHAKVKALSTYAMLHSTSDLSADAQFHLARRAAYVKARAISHAIVKLMQDNGIAEDKIDMIVSASADLYADILTADNRLAIIAAYVNFKAQVNSVLDFRFENFLTAFNTIRESITGSLMVNLETSLEATSSAQQMQEAYITFYSSIGTMVSTMMEGATDAEINFATELFILANLQI